MLLCAVKPNKQPLQCSCILTLDIPISETRSLNPKTHLTILTRPHTTVRCPADRAAEADQRPSFRPSEGVAEATVSCPSIECWFWGQMEHLVTDWFTQGFTAGMMPRAMLLLAVLCWLMALRSFQCMLVSFAKQSDCLRIWAFSSFKISTCCIKELRWAGVWALGSVVQPCNAHPHYLLAGGAGD